MRSINGRGFLKVTHHVVTYGTIWKSINKYLPNEEWGLCQGHTNLSCQLHYGDCFQRPMLKKRKKNKAVGGEGKGWCDVFQKVHIWEVSRYKMPTKKTKCKVHCLFPILALCESPWDLKSLVVVVLGAGLWGGRDLTLPPRPFGPWPQSRLCLLCVVVVVAPWDRNTPSVRQACLTDPGPSPCGDQQS